MIEAIEAQAHERGTREEAVPVGEPDGAPRRGRTRTCVGCSERIDLNVVDEEVVRLILGPGGEIAVDPKGGGFGRGAHVHARRDCVERAAKGGLLRATKGNAHLVVDGAVTMGSPVGVPPTPPDERSPEGPPDEANDQSAGAPLSGDSLARAIRRSLDRRIQGLVAAAVRSRRIAAGADAVTGACKRGDAEMVIVACDASAAAELTEVRRAMSEGRAVAWGTKRKLGSLVHAGAPTHTVRAAAAAEAGVGVIAISSRTLAVALRRAVHAASAVASAPATSPTRRNSSAKERGRGKGPDESGGLVNGRATAARTRRG
jgi:predicted RNA-binding protein YlxR (DUF448 family)/ribosomal protein L7Ae-like RNA K-turn-binding protein